MSSNNLFELFDLLTLAFRLEKSEKCLVSTCSLLLGLTFQLSKSGKESLVSTCFLLCDFYCEQSEDLHVPRIACGLAENISHQRSLLQADETWQSSWDENEEIMRTRIAREDYYYNESTLSYRQVQPIHRSKARPSNFRP